jgi:1,2-diacylglycerol 3-alpha-glucosyltransferase
MNSAKNILILTPGFPADEDDDTCIPPLQEFLIEFSNQFPSVKFFIIVLQYPFEKKKYFWKNIPVYSCGGGNKRFPFRIFSWLRAFRYFFKIRKETKINLIHSFWLGEAALLGNFFSYIFKIPHLNTLMGQDVLNENKYLKLISGRKVKTIAVSKRQKDIFKKNVDKEVLDVIPFGISRREINPENLLRREIDILGAGSLIELKNYKLFINVIKKLIPDYPNLICVLIGEGEEKGMLLNLIKELKLENNIYLTGKLGREKVFDYMKKSKILLHTSKYESLGYVFEEALMFGLTIVSFETGIAESSGKWKVCKAEEEIYFNLRQLLKCNLNYTPEILYNIEETVKAYWKVYNN